MEMTERRPDPAIDTGLSARNLESDETLIERFQTERSSGDFEQLFNRHWSFAYRVALCLCMNRTLAEDAVQETFACLFRTQKNFENRGPGSFQAWLYGVVALTARDVQRKERRLRAREQGVRYRREIGAVNAACEHPGNRPQADDAREALEKALSNLDEDLRVPLVLHYLEGLTQLEIGRMVGVGGPQVSRRISKGLELLRGRLEAAGISCSVAALPGLLQGLPEFQVPAGLGARVMERLHLAARASRRIVRTTAPGKPALAWAVALTLAAAGVAVWAWKSQSGAPRPEPVQADAEAAPLAPQAELEASRTESEAPRSGILRRWDFNSPKLPQGIRILEGKWHYVIDGGPDGSGCMETDTDHFSAELDVPAKLRNLKIDFKAKMHPWPEKPGVSISFSVLWHPYDQVCLFRNIGRPVVVKPGSEKVTWFAYRKYVTEAFIDTWVENQRTALLVIEPMADSRLRWSLRGRHRIDDLTITEITPQQAPDVSKYLDALAEIPASQRVGSIVVPGLRGEGVPSKPVIVEFHGASSTSLEE